MIANKALHRIQTGEASAKEARKALRDALVHGDSRTAASVYEALRGWTWSAISERRFDDEMEDWFKVLQSASVALADVDYETSKYLVVLSHLVDDSLRVAPRLILERLLTRSHLGDLLEIVRRHNGRIERSALAEQAGLSASRLSQLLSELVLVGALHREPDGKRALYVLSDLGRDVLDRWKAKPAAEEETPEPSESFLPRMVPPSENTRQYAALLNREAVNAHLKQISAQVASLSAPEPGFIFAIGSGSGGKDIVTGVKFQPANTQVKPIPHNVAMAQAVESFLPPKVRVTPTPAEKTGARQHAH